MIIRFGYNTSEPGMHVWYGADLIRKPQHQSSRKDQNEELSLLLLLCLFCFPRVCSSFVHYVISCLFAYRDLLWGLPIPCLSVSCSWAFNVKNPDFACGNSRNLGMFQSFDSSPQVCPSRFCYENHMWKHSRTNSVPLELRERGSARCKTQDSNTGLPPGLPCTPFLCIADGPSGLYHIFLGAL